MLMQLIGAKNKYVLQLWLQVIDDKYERANWDK